MNRAEKIGLFVWVYSLFSLQDADGERRVFMLILVVVGWVLFYMGDKPIPGDKP